MGRRAWRLALRFRQGWVRRAWLMFACVVMSQSAWAEGRPSSEGALLVEARYGAPTARYPHGVLGDGIEFASLELVYEDPALSTVIRLPEHLVFEDTAPRMVDVDGDGVPEAVVVQSHQDKGARLAVFNHSGMVAATPFIGQRFRWLAPIGAADLDGDGFVEIAYVDRPHLAKTLRVVRFQDGALREVAALKGVSNHRIGERDIAGGIRNCEGGAQMIVADGNWQRLLAVSLTDGALRAVDIGPHRGRASFASAMTCQ